MATGMRMLGVLSMLEYVHMLICGCAGHVCTYRVAHDIPAHRQVPLDQTQAISNLSRSWLAPGGMGRVTRDPLGPWGEPRLWRWVCWFVHNATESAREASWHCNVT